MKILSRAISTVGASTMTIGLFLAMAELATQEETHIIEVSYPEFEDYTYSPYDIEVKFDDIDVPPPPKPVDPPEPPEPIENIVDPPLWTDDTDYHEPIDIDRTSIPRIEISDSDYVILVGAAPRYPRREIQKGVEGYTVVSFSIDRDGIPFNPTILTSQPEGVFDASSLVAIKKFRFKPRVVNGQAEEVHGAQYRFTYKMEK